MVTLITWELWDLCYNGDRLQIQKRQLGLSMGINIDVLNRVHLAVQYNGIIQTKLYRAFSNTAALDTHTQTG